MKLKILSTILLLATSWICLHSKAESSQVRIYSGEKEILFKNDGRSVKAYEGSIQVQENRSDPNSRKIPVKYVRFPATTNKKSSPIIYLSGGPGGSGISTAKYPKFRFPLFMALREFGDVIALDQRGTGKAKVAPRCNSSQTMSLQKKVSEAQIIKRYRKAAAECVSFWNKEGVDVLGYTSIQSAMDIDELRQHFNAKKVTLWGISYGSHLALASLKVMPGKIDKMVLASVEGLDQTVKLPKRTDAYFDRLQLAISQQPKAAQAYPNIKALMRRVHEKLETSPIVVKIPQKDGNQKNFLFQKMHMQGIASAMIADPHRGVPRLLAMYKAIDKGHHDFLPQIIKRAGFDERRISFDVMSFGMDIASGMTAKKKQLVAKQGKTSLLGNTLNFPMPQLNKSINGLDLGDSYRSLPKSDVPTLLLTGTLDGRTYIEGQKEATQGLTHLTQVMVVNGGHNLFMLSPKVTDVIKTFLRGDKIKTDKIEVVLPSFVIAH